MSVEPLGFYPCATQTCRSGIDLRATQQSHKSPLPATISPCGRPLCHAFVFSTPPAEIAADRSSTARQLHHNSITTQNLQPLCWRELGNSTWMRAMVRGSRCPMKATLRLINLLRDLELFPNTIPGEVGATALHRSPNPQQGGI